MTGELQCGRLAVKDGVRLVRRIHNMQRATPQWLQQSHIAFCNTAAGAGARLLHLRALSGCRRFPLVCSEAVRLPWAVSAFRIVYSTLLVQLREAAGAVPGMATILDRLDPSVRASVSSLLRSFLGRIFVVEDPLIVRNTYLVISCDLGSRMRVGEDRNSGAHSLTPFAAKQRPPPLFM
ncbi:hypothetical protein NDU88_008377 [Pleurodeles waltl]|uniref:Uncharacterized protein n=1 Tax=Pleurodeles waltl TaxID=8319 RepID=A0AAV7PQ79_PLEWA|nr:hypothetical protein NDU88_008377 [Pleurodeles waltl]